MEPEHNDPLEHVSLGMEDHAEAVVLLLMGVLGVLMNALLLIAILSWKQLRRPINAFVFHHVLLDAFRCVYCFFYAYGVLYRAPPPGCHLLGATFTVCVTSSAFSHLAMSMAEAYIFNDVADGQTDSGNHCCVLFAIATVWFSSLILNLGVALLPSTATFVYELAQCTFAYRNYVLHLLWSGLLTLAMTLTVVYLRHLHRDIQQCQYEGLRRKLCQHADALEESVIGNVLQQVERLCVRRVRILASVCALFAVFWYPLILLTAIDLRNEAPPRAYRWLSIAACSQSALNPLLMWMLLKSKLPDCQCDEVLLNRRPARGLSGSGGYGLCSPPNSLLMTSFNAYA